MVANKARPVGSKTIWQQLLAFVVRWAVSSVAMWVCISLFSHTDPDLTSNIWTYAWAGFIFSLVNSVIKPFVTLLSLPFIPLTLGLSVLLINAAMVAITVWILPGITIDFGGAVLSAITISIINYLVNFLVPSYNK